MIEIALLAIAVLVILLTLGVPLPYCFGGGLMVMYFLGDVTMKGNMLWGVQQLGNPVLLAIPLFVLAGTIMSESGIAASLLRFVSAFIGHVRGGLGVVAAVSCAVIGAISGSGLTGIAAIGPILIPEMEKRRYPREYATALIANSSILAASFAPRIPPNRRNGSVMVWRAVWRGLRLSRTAVIAPPLPAVSRPSNSTTIRAPLALTQRAMLTSSSVSGSSAASVVASGT